MTTTFAIESQTPLSGLTHPPEERHSPERELEARELEARERDQLTDRLLSLRRVLPVLAQEMATARRQAAHLKLDNRRLSEQVRELRAQLEARERESR